MVDRNSVILDLEQMIRYGYDLTQLFKLTFFFTFPTEEAAREAAALLKAKEGVDSEVYIVPPPLWKALFVKPKWAVYGTRLLIPERDEIVRLTDLFNAVAKKYGGSYDGWEGKLAR